MLLLLMLLLLKLLLILKLLMLILHCTPLHVLLLKVSLLKVRVSVRAPTAAASAAADPRRIPSSRIHQNDLGKNPNNWIKTHTQIQTIIHNYEANGYSRQSRGQ